ncbi:MAG: VOC family protein [Marmoricola sp.]
MVTSQHTRSEDDPEVRPVVRQVVLDCSDPRALAEFYRELLGYRYRPGDELPPAGEPDPRGGDWLVLRPRNDDPRGDRGLAFQYDETYLPPEWSADSSRGPTGRPQMLHLDMTVPNAQALFQARDRALGLGATVLHDRAADPAEPLYVFADPMGHPFCIFVG